MTDITKPMILASGYFLVPEFSATGGVKYKTLDTQEERDGDRLTAEWATRKDVDHVGLLQLSRKIINSAYHAAERWASNTPIGYFVSLDNWPKLQAEMAEIAAEADRFNHLAAQLGSGRRCKIALYPIRMQEDDETAAKRLAETVRERMQDLFDALRAGDTNAYAGAMKKAKNLHKLARGIQADSILIGLEAARNARKALGEGISAKRDPAVVGAELDLNAIESAIVLFTDSVNAGLFEEGPEESAAL
jgi:hypothetical protein